MIPLDPLTHTLAAAGRVLAAERLVSAFGHVSVRDGDDLVITPPTPLSRVNPHRCVRIPLDSLDLPVGTPREAWLHLTIYRSRPEVRAICRAQPEIATALGSTDRPIVPLHGQGAFCGPEVVVFDDAQSIRKSARAVRLAEALGDQNAVILRGNGAVTVGVDIGRATARMWVLEMSARMNAAASAAGTVRPLSPEDQHAWRATESELLGRLWRHLARTHAPEFPILDT